MVGKYIRLESIGCENNSFIFRIEKNTGGRQLVWLTMGWFIGYRKRPGVRGSYSYLHVNWDAGWSPQCSH